MRWGAQPSFRPLVEATVGTSPSRVDEDGLVVERLCVQHVEIVHVPLVRIVLRGTPARVHAQRAEALPAVVTAIDVASGIARDICGEQVDSRGVDVAYGAQSRGK